MGVVLLTSSDARLCFVDIWNTLVCISWYLPLVLATSSFVWSILASSVVLDVSHPLSCDSLVGSSLWASCCLGHIFFLPCIQSHLLPMIIHCSFLTLGCYMQVHSSGNYIPAVKSPPKTYKPTFHSGYLSCNMSHGGAATIWVFCLPWWR